MLSYTTQDHIFTARTHRGIIAQMKRAAWQGDAKKQPYMRAVADRVRDVHGAIIPTDSPQRFIEALLSIGWLHSAS